MLDGGSSVVKLALIYPHLSFCTRADARPQWEEGGGRGSGAGPRTGVGVEAGWEEMRSLSRWAPRWLSVGAPVWGAEVQKA